MSLPGRAPRAVPCALLLGLAVLLGGRAAAEVGLFELPDYYEYSPDLLSSGQPADDQFEAIRAAGVALVVDLSPHVAGSAQTGEAARAAAAGLGYVALPVDWEAPRHETLVRFFAVLDEARGVPVLVHCRQGARAAVFVFLYRVLRLGVDAVAARRVLESLWDANPGQALARTPQWQRFIDDALAAGAPAATASAARPPANGRPPAHLPGSGLPDRR